ncbi:hypothetical protein L1987_33952 [Smallanthus sonchifolius]|uniref:Uncharacterized protein n=1 Tax=Smallanthus sonchifolius TaxID=185202 RepID=A0ACB9HS92_9ASTR|nr:hypothetical protein L1987_33952 [Smallanthus sonchifolius]
MHRDISEVLLVGQPERGKLVNWVCHLPCTCTHHAHHWGQTKGVFRKWWLHIVRHPAKSRERDRKRLISARGKLSLSTNDRGKPRKTKQKNTGKKVQLQASDAQCSPLNNGKVGDWSQSLSSYSIVCLSLKERNFDFKVRISVPYFHSSSTPPNSGTSETFLLSLSVLILVRLD